MLNFMRNVLADFGEDATMLSLPRDQQAQPSPAGPGGGQQPGPLFSGAGYLDAQPAWLSPTGGGGATPPWSAAAAEAEQASYNAGSLAAMLARDLEKEGEPEGQEGSTAQQDWRTRE